MNTGHDYVIKSIPSYIWSRARKRAMAEEVSMRVILIRALADYAAGRSEL